MSTVKSDVETLSPTRVKLTVEVPFDELQPSVDAAYRKIAAQVTVPGFRKGKVPTRIIDQRFGRGAVLEEAINEALPRAYEMAMRESGKLPVGRPEVDVTGIEEATGLTFTAEVDVRPEFDLPDVSGLHVQVDDAEPSDADVDEGLTGLRTRFATLSPVDRPAADGDVLLVDISGRTAAGAAVEDLSGSALSYELGSDDMLPGLDDAVRDLSAGETATFSFTPTAGDWEGIELVVDVTVTAVRERVLPEADDDFAQLASEFDTIEELRDDVRHRLTRVRMLEQRAQARSRVHEALLDLVDIPVPEATVAAEVEEHFADGHGDESHRDEVLEEARKTLKSQFILDKLADQENMSVGESELSAWLMQNAARYGMSPDAFAQAVVESGQVSSAMQDVRRAKALAFVVDRAEIVDASGRPVDLAELDAQVHPASHHDSPALPDAGGDETPDPAAVEVPGEEA